MDPQALNAFSLTSLVAGNLINWLLYGVLTVQLYLYYLAFPNDKTWTKAAVYTVYIIETVHAIGLGITLLSITSSGGPYTGSLTLDLWTGLVDSRWFTQALLIYLASGLVPLIVQCIYAHRIRILTQRKVVPWLIIILGVMQLLAAIVSALGLGMFTIPLWAGLNVVNDSVITFIMIRSLWKEKPLSNFTKLKVTELVHLVIATGALTVTANVLTFIVVLLALYTADTISYIGVAILILTPKLYANSVLVMLNNRMTIKTSQDATPNISTNVLSTLTFAYRVGPSDSATLQRSAEETDLEELVQNHSGE